MHGDGLLYCPAGSDVCGNADQGYGMAHQGHFTLTCFCTKIMMIFYEVALTIVTTCLPLKRPSHCAWKGLWMYQCCPEIDVIG